MHIWRRLAPAFFLIPFAPANTDELRLTVTDASGLPLKSAVAQFGQRVVDRVDFATGGVKASWSFDASAGVVLAKTAGRSLRLQVEVRNLTNRLNLIN